MQQLDNHLQHFKNFTQDVNSLPEETSLFINVDVIASKLKANANLTLANVEIATQSHCTLFDFWFQIFFTFLLYCKSCGQEIVVSHINFKNTIQLELQTQVFMISMSDSMLNSGPFSHAHNPCFAVQQSVDVKRGQGVSFR